MASIREILSGEGVRKKLVEILAKGGVWKNLTAVKPQKCGRKFLENCQSHSTPPHVIIVRSLRIIWSLSNTLRNICSSKSHLLRNILSSNTHPLRKIFSSKTHPCFIIIPISSNINCLPPGPIGRSSPSFKYLRVVSIGRIENVEFGTLIIMLIFCFITIKSIRICSDLSNLWTSFVKNCNFLQWISMKRRRRKLSP